MPKGLLLAAAVAAVAAATGEMGIAVRGPSVA